MNREIKFRVWMGNHMEYNVIAGKFGAFYVNPENGNGLDPKDTASLTPNNTRYFDDTPLMQYTGLKDKNGKEIYEGDIVMCGDIIVAVTWKDAAFHLITNESQGASVFVQNRAKHFEVIGNIYENPELLRNE